MPIVSSCSSTTSTSELFLVGRADHLGPDDQEPGRHQVLIALRLGAEGEQIAGKLFRDEPVERLVGVERADHVVAIAPGVIIGEVLVRPIGVGVTSDVEPVAAPVHPEFGAAQERIDDPGERVGRVVLDERRDLGWRRRDADQVEEDSPQQRRPVGVGDREEPLRLEPGEEEPIDIGAGPRLVLHSRHGRFADRLERPVRTARIGIDSRGPLGCGIGSGIRRPHRDPSLQDADLRLRQLSPRRHLERLVANRLDQHALLRRSGHKGGTAVPPLDPPSAAVETQAPLEDLRLRGVARVTMLDEEGTHLLLEEMLLLGAERHRVAGARGVCAGSGSGNDGSIANEHQQHGQDVGSKVHRDQA